MHDRAAPMQELQLQKSTTEDGWHAWIELGVAARVGLRTLFPTRARTRAVSSTQMTNRSQGRPRSSSGTSLFVTYRQDLRKDGSVHLDAKGNDSFSRTNDYACARPAEIAHND